MIAVIPSDIEENLHYIELLTRKKIQNPLVGNHLSMLKGHGYDFWDHKRYQHGDDTRRIDWNATARMGYTLLKNTHEEREIDVFILADISRSMEMEMGGRSKRELLLYVTAVLTLSALSDHMRIGFLGFTDRVEIDLEPKKGKAHLWEVLDRIWDFRPGGHKSTRVVPALEKLRQRLRRMSLVFLISDFCFEENMFEELIFKQISSHHDVIPIILRDPFEIGLPAGRGCVRFRDLETGQEQMVRLSPRNWALYADSIRRRRRELIGQLYRFGLDFQEIRTDQSFHDLILGLFLMRKRR